MIHEIYYVKSFEIVAPFTLHIIFDDESEQVIDFEPVLRGRLFRPLRNPAVFNRVRLDPEIHNLVWPNDAAFDPETLRNWPNYREEFIALTQSWERVLIAQ